MVMKVNEYYNEKTKKELFEDPDDVAALFDQFMKSSDKFSCDSTRFDNNILDDIC